MPAAFSTAPPDPAFVESSQSPALALGLLACKSPSIDKPPDGEMKGATPAGGGVASAVILQKSNRLKKTELFQSAGPPARPLRVASFKCINLQSSARPCCSIK